MRELPDLQREAQEEISSYLARRGNLVPEVEVGPLADASLGERRNKFEGELFLSTPRFRATVKELDAALSRVADGIAAGEIMSNRIDPHKSRVQRQKLVPTFYEERGALLTLAAWLELELTR